MFQETEIHILKSLCYLLSTAKLYQFDLLRQILECCSFVLVLVFKDITVRLTSKGSTRENSSFDYVRDF